MAPTQNSFTIGPNDEPSNDPRRNPFVTEESASKFDARVEESLAYWHVPGTALAIIDGNHIVSRGYGIARFEESCEKGELGEGIPVTPNTLFNCASMSKSFTAAATALLVEDKNLEDVKWDAPVSKLCADYVFSDERMTEYITVEDTLCHRSGLAGHDEFIRGIAHRTPDTPESIMCNLRNLPFSRPLRSDYQYNNTIYTATSHLVARLSQTPFPAFLKSKFWDPLSMSRTYLGKAAVPSQEQPTLGEGHVWLKDAKILHPIPHYSDPGGEGCGEIISSVEDWARWVHAFIHRSDILSPSSYDDLTRPRIYADQDDVGPFWSPCFYALGWEVCYYHGYTIISHGGSWAGFISNMVYIPAKRWGYVAMGNAEAMWNARPEFAWHLIDELLGVKEEDRFDFRKMKEESEPKDYSKEKVFPELVERQASNAKTEVPTLSLQAFAGKYWNNGYRDLTFVWNEETETLEADVNDRSIPFWIRVKEHAYELWYVAEVTFDDLPEDRNQIRCQFEVVEHGQCVRVGIDFCEELDGLIWFDKMDEPAK